jgi:hypothetical protein
MKYLILAVVLAALCGVAFAQVADQFPGPMILCPECGAEPVLVRKHSKYRVECPEKHCLRGPKCRTADQAVCLWNAQIVEIHQGD